MRARIEKHVKRDAESIFKRLGVSHSTFINMSYRAVVEEGGTPIVSPMFPMQQRRGCCGKPAPPRKRGKYAKAASPQEFAESSKVRSKRQRHAQY